MQGELTSGKGKQVYIPIKAGVLLETPNAADTSRR